MLQLCLRARAHSYFRGKLGNQQFKARSADRDAETDQLRVSSILGALENALHAAELEQSGLNRRFEDWLARAAVTTGNATAQDLGSETPRSHPRGFFNAA